MAGHLDPVFQEVFMSIDVEICAVCAWRTDCKKKFSVSGKDIHCSDFVRDISIEEKKENE
jgi:hypothetical protein